MGEETFDAWVGIEILTAAAQNDVAKLKRLVSLGADPNYVGESGNTPLYNACVSNKIEAIEALLELGADPNQRITYRSSVDKLVETDRLPIMYALSPGAVKLLLARGVDVNAVDAIGVTALMLAAWRGNLDPVASLLAAGANPLLRGLSNPRSKRLHPEPLRLRFVLKKGLNARELAESKLEMWDSVKTVETNEKIEARIELLKQIRLLLLDAEKRAEVGSH
jgi:ankyrin repeat protein